MAKIRRRCRRVDGDPQRDLSGLRHARATERERSDLPSGIPLPDPVITEPARWKVTPGDRGFAVHSSSFTQAHVRATHQRRDVGAATGADAGQTPDMPPLRCAHAPGPPRANAPRATHRVATPCTGPPNGRVGWASTHTRLGDLSISRSSELTPHRHTIPLPLGTRAARAWSYE